MGGIRKMKDLLEIICGIVAIIIYILIFLIGVAIVGCIPILVLCCIGKIAIFIFGNNLVYYVLIGLILVFVAFLR